MLTIRTDLLLHCPRAPLPKTLTAYHGEDWYKGKVLDLCFGVTFSNLHQITIYSEVFFVFSQSVQADGIVSNGHYWVHHNM
jgi:hypothetical protein